MGYKTPDDIADFAGELPLTSLAKGFQRLCERGFDVQDLTLPMAVGADGYHLSAESRCGQRALTAQDVRLSALAGLLLCGRCRVNTLYSVAGAPFEEVKEIAERVNVLLSVEHLERWDTERPLDLFAKHDLVGSIEAQLESYTDGKHKLTPVHELGQAQVLAWKEWVTTDSAREDLRDLCAILTKRVGKDGYRSERQRRHQEGLVYMGIDTDGNDWVFLAIMPLLDAFTVVRKGDRRIMEMPRVVARYIQRARNVQGGGRSRPDTPDVLETAITLWEPGSRTEYADLYTAFQAARNI